MCPACVCVCEMVRGSRGRESIQEERDGGREGEREQACPFTHHAPGISYLKFSRSAPLKPFRTANKGRNRTHRTGQRSEDIL